MIRKALAAGASALAISLAAPLQLHAEAAANSGDPAPMTWPKMGFDPADLDPSINPGNDFWAYVNGKWSAANPIPPQYATYGVSRDLSLKAERQVAEIVHAMAAAEAPEGSIEQRVGDSYKAFVDTDAINANGLKPLQPYLDQIAAIASETDLAEFFAAPGMPDPFAIAVQPGMDTPDTNILNIWIGGYSLPDRDNYLVDNEKNREMQAKYKEYLTFLLGKAGYAEPEAAAGKVFDLEHQIAALAFDRTLSRDPELLNNTVGRKDLIAMAGSKFPLQTYLDGLTVGGTETLVVDEMPPGKAKIEKLGLTDEDLGKLGAGFPAMLKLVGDVPLDTWKAWSTAQLLQSYAPDLPSDIDKRNFDFWGTYIAGVKEQRTREKRALSSVQSQMGEAVGKLYVERNFPPESKLAMQQLVANLLSTMDGRISGLAWMSDETKAAAHKKLAAVRVKIGYPDKFKTYDGMVMSPDAPIANAISASAWEWKDSAGKLGKPVDKSEWYMTPQTVNAYYSPSGNEIVFPAAYLQPPNFALHADPAVNYGAIGMTIGHEISHGFDNRGSKFDGSGALRNWWTADDKAKFDAKTAELVEQFDAFCPLDDGKLCVNGELTLGENIADLAGLTIAYYAYQASLGGKEAPVIDGLTGDQRFFIAFAIANRGKWTEELTRYILQTDPHSPDVARTNVILSNFDPWYAAFDVKPGDELYRAPDQRVRIW